MKYNDLPVYVRTRAEAVPAGVMKIAKQRAGDMLRFYGRFIDTISLQALCESCYVQGAEDMAMAVANAEKPKEPIDFQI